MDPKDSDKTSRRQVLGKITAGVAATFASPMLAQA